MKKTFQSFTIAALCLGTVCWVAGQFDNQRPSESVYSGTFKSLDRVKDQSTLTDVNLRLHSLPEGFIEEPIEIWPCYQAHA